MELIAGCSGWEDGKLLSRFFPDDMNPENYLRHYGGLYDFIEVTSTLDTLPDRFTTIKWATFTPDNLRFAIKLPKSITFIVRPSPPIAELESFYDSISALDNKIVAFLISLPQSLTFKQGFAYIKELVGELDKKYRYAFDPRHHSWFTKDVYKFLTSNQIALAWTQGSSFKTPPEITSDFAYIRLVGDNEVQDQAKRAVEIKSWAARLKMAEKKLKFAIVTANYSYAGNAPATIKQFKQVFDS